jgi:hypothetical protein
LSKVRAALKKQTAGRSAKSYRKLGRKIQFQHNTVQKYLRLAVSAGGISEPVLSKLVLHSTKKFTCPNFYQFFINLSEKIVFWLDLAPAFSHTWLSLNTQIGRPLSRFFVPLVYFFLHYTKDTLVRLVKLKIAKEENPTKIPQIRPIVNFWANLKRKVYSNNYSTKDVKCFMEKIKKELNSIETMGIRKAMK